MKKLITIIFTVFCLSAMAQQTGIIFETSNEFYSWNYDVTTAMKSQGQQMEVWCLPIIARDSSGRSFGITQTSGIRREIIKQFIDPRGYTEVTIQPTDSLWFKQEKPFSIIQN